MNKRTNAFICIFLSLVMCIGLTSCNGGQSNIGTQDGDTTQNEVIHYYNFDADYSIEYKDGGYVIVLEDPSIYKTSETSNIMVSMPSTIEFSTMKEFKESVTTGKLTDSQKRIMARSFEKDADGAILTCDFSRLYVPTLPNTGTVVGGVNWTGLSYGFSIGFDNGVSGSLYCLTEERYEGRYKTDYVEFFDNDNITVTQKETIDNKEVVNYKTDVAKLKNVRYSMSAKGKMITVDKTFLLETDYPNLLTASSIVPSHIELYCTINGQHCVIYLHSLTEDPTDEWLLEFGLTEFVDNESAEKLEVVN